MKKLEAVTNMHVTSAFMLTFNAPAEANGLKATHYRIRVADVTIPAKHEEWFVSEVADETASPSVALKKINTNLPKEAEVPYKAGVLYEVTVTPLTGAGTKGKKGKAAVINFIVSPTTGEAEENGHTLDLGAKPSETAPTLAAQPQCTLTGKSLAIFRHAGEESYDVCAIKVTGEKEEMVGSCRIEAVMTGKVEVKDIFSKMAWVKNPENGTYKVQVFAVNAEGKQSKAASFPPAEYTFTAPEAPAKTDASGTDASKGAGTTDTKKDDAKDAGVKKDEGKGTDKPAAGPSPEDAARLKEVPVRLKKITDDLNALPKDNWKAFGTLTRMSYALTEDIIPFLVLVAIFGDKSGADAKSLLDEAQALSDEVETTRAFRSDNWNLDLKPRLLRIKEIIDKLGYQAGEVGEAAFKELATMMAIVNGKTPGMTMKDITVLLVSSAQLLRDVEALLVEKNKADKQKGGEGKGAERSTRTNNPPEKPPGKPNTETSAECPEEDAVEIQELYREIESRLTNPDEETIGAVKTLIKTLEAKVSRTKKAYPKTDVKSVETNLAWARNTLAGLVEKAEKDKKKGADENKDDKGGKDGGKDKDKKAKGPNPFKSAWNWVQARQRKIWPFLILLLLLLLGWWLYNHFMKDATSVAHSAPAAPSVKRQVESVPTTVQTSSVPATVVGANVAHDIRVRNTFKGGVRGKGHIIGNGQVNISSNYYIYNGLGSSTPVKANEPAAIQLPASLSSDKKCSDGSYRWDIALAPGQTYSRGTRPGWGLQVNSDAASPMDLTTEIKGLDNKWHMMLPDSTNTVAGTEYRFTACPSATRAVELNFRLFPTKK